MNLGDNFSDSFEYTKKLFSDAGRLIILIVLSIIPIVDLIVIGYQARVLRESPGTGTPPKLEKYGELFVDGAKVFFAAVIYMLIPLILIAVGGVSTSCRPNVDLRSGACCWACAGRGRRRDSTRRHHPHGAAVDHSSRRNGAHD